MPARPSLSDAQSRLVAARSAGRTHEVIDALTALARCWAGEQAWGTAEAHLEEALRWAWLAGGCDARVALHCEAAEMAALDAERSAERNKAGARRRALTHAGEAARLSEHVACPAWEVVVLLRASDVFDRCGERDEAVALQTRAVLMMALAAP